MKSKKNQKSIRNIKKALSISDLQKIKGGLEQLKDAAIGGGGGLGSSSGG